MTDSHSCHIVVNLSKRRLSYFEGDQLVKEYPIGIGKASTPTPVGTYSVIAKVSKPKAAGLGTRCLHLSGTTACIHGTDDPSSIGGLVSGG
jgi:lipoprotein-anchoring transpeptidase ErfK/SrfK